MVWPLSKGHWLIPSTAGRGGLDWAAKVSYGLQPAIPQSVAYQFSTPIRDVSTVPRLFFGITPHATNALLVSVIKIYYN